MINRKIAMSLLSIVAALSVVGGAAYAAFSATSSSNGNAFSAGTLTLTVTPAGGTVSSPAFTFSNIAPGDEFTKSISLANTGTVNSTTTVLESISITGNSATNLGDKLNLEIWNDVDNNGLISPGDTLQGSGAVTSPAWTNIPLGFGINALGAHQVIAKITFDPTADNSYQSTNVTFNLNFKTSQ